MSNKTIMVTGGAGYIGSHIVRGLKDAARNVVVYDDLRLGHREAVPNGVDLVVGADREADTVADDRFVLRNEAQELEGLHILFIARPHPSTAIVPQRVGNDLQKIEGVQVLTNELGECVLERQPHAETRDS